MQKPKRRSGGQTRAKDDQAHQNQHRSLNEQTNSETTELNNNCMNQSEDAASVARHTEIDSTSEMTEPRTEDVHKKTDIESGELMLDKTERNSHPVINASETNLGNFLQEINELIAAEEPKRKRTRKPRSTPQKIINEPEPTEINNDPGCDTDETSVTQIQTDSISQISKPKAKSTRKRKGRLPKKLIKSKEILKEENLNPTTVNTSSDCRLQVVSISERPDPKDDPTCTDEDTLPRKRMKPEPTTINNNLVCINEDVPLATHIQTYLMSKTSQPKAQCVRRPRGKPRRNPMKVKKIVVDVTPSTATGDTLSHDSWVDIVSTSDTEHNVLSKLEATQQQKITKLETIEMSNGPKSKIADILSGNTAQINSPSKPKAKFVCKPRGRRPKNETKSKKIVIKDKPIFESTVTSSDSWLELESTPKKVKPRKPRGRKPKSTQEKMFVKSEPTEMNSIPGCETENLPVVSEIKTDTTSKISKPKAKSRGRSRKTTKLIKLEPMDIDMTLGCGDVSQASQVKTDSISITAKPKVKRVYKRSVKKPKQLIESETSDHQKSNSGCETKHISLVNRVKTDLLSEIPEPKTKLARKPLGCEDVSQVPQVKSDSISMTAKPKVKRVYKPRAKKPKQLIESETSDYQESNSGCETKHISLVFQVETDLLSEIPKPKTKLPRKPNAKKIEKMMKMEKMNTDIDKCETTRTYAAPLVETDSASETTKPNPKCRLKTALEESTVVLKSDNIEVALDLKKQTQDVPLENCSVNTLTPMIKEPEIESSTKNHGTAMLNKIEDSKTMEIDDNPANERESLPSKSSSRNDSLSETLKAGDNSREKCEAVTPTIESGVMKTTRRSDHHTDTSNDKSLKNHSLCYSIPETVKTKNQLLDGMYQPIVLLENIAYTNILSDEQKKRLLKTRRFRKILNPKDKPDSSTTQSIKPHDIVNKVSPKLQKKNNDHCDKPSSPQNSINTKVSPKREKRNDNKSVEGITSVVACDDKHLTPTKRRVRTKGKMKAKSKVLEVKSWDETYKSKLTVRNSETNVRNENEMDVLSSVGNDEFNIYKYSPSSGLPSVQGSSAQPVHNFGKKSTESVVPPEEDILMWPLPEMMEIGIPLDLSIRNSDKSISIQSVFSKPSDCIKEICSTTTKHQSQDTNLHNIGFGSSTFNVTDLSTSFTDIEVVPDTVPESTSTPSENINISKNPTPRKHQRKDQTVSLHKPPRSTEKISPTTSTASKCATKQTKPNTICKKSVRAKPEKLPSTDTLSLKVSIPAKHYFNKKLLASKKSDTVIERKKITSKKANTESHTVFKETDHQASKSITSSTPKRKPSEIQVNLMTTKWQKPTEGNSNKHLEVPAPSPNMCAVDNEDSSFQETLRRCDTNYVRDFEPALLGSISNPKITNVRSLPKIVTDEFLPKGTITIPSLNCNKSTMPRVFTTETENESYSENQVDSGQEIHEATIHQQSTYTAIANVSQSQPIADLRNHPLASTSTCKINNDIDIPQKLENSRGISKYEKVSEKMQTNDTDRNFDSTQLWKICPELADYFSHDDVANNNDDKKLSNFDAPHMVKSNRNENRLRRSSAKMDTGTNVQIDTDLRSNNVLHIPENASSIRDVFEGVIATNVDYREMEVESESIASQNESNWRECLVVANLTAANLRNFNNISNHGKGGLKWSAETCQYYVSHGDAIRQSDKPMPNNAVETSYRGTESNSESQKEFFQVESKKRKRKWLDEDRNASSKAVKEKRLKLNRNKWSIDGRESVNSDNISTSNVVEDVQSSQKTSHQEMDKARKTNKLETNVGAEKIEVSQSKYKDRPEELEQEIADCTEKTSQMEKIETSTVVPANTANSWTLRRSFGNDSCLQAELDGTRPQRAESDYSNSIIDKNGNLTSSSSSSSSSSSQSGKSMSNHEGSIHSKNLENKSPEQDVPEKDLPQPCKIRCPKKEEQEDEVDGDCISLFAESMFTNFDQPTTLDDGRLSPLFDSVKEPEEKFQDMTDIGAYFDRNVQEYNEAYESCVQEDENMRNTSWDIPMPDTSMNENYDEIIPQQFELNSSQLNLSQPMQSYGHNSRPLTSNLQRQNCTSIRNLKDFRLGEEREKNNFPAYVEGIFNWQCYKKLRRGACNRKNCQFFHHLDNKLENLDQQNPDLINEVIDYAMYNGYNYFISHIYPKVIERLNYLNIMKLFYKLNNHEIMGNEYLIKVTIAAVKKNSISLRQFLSDAAYLLNENDDTVANCILKTVGPTIKVGAYWETCRDLLIKFQPSSVSLSQVIHECLQQRDELLIQDMYFNYVIRLTPEQVSSININLREQLDLLFAETHVHVLPKSERSTRSALFENVNPAAADRSVQINLQLAQDNCKRRSYVPTILSPDDTAHQNYDDLLAISSGSKQIGCQKLSPQDSFPIVQQTSFKNRNTRSNSTASNYSSSHQRRGATATIVSSHEQKTSPVLSIEPECSPNAANSTSSSFRLHRIENLRPLQSAFRDRHWRFHLDMNNLKEALKHSEYPLALSILDKYSEMEKTIFTTSCYKMLRKNVMASTQHVKNMINLSVRMGVNKFLNETLVNLGTYMMIELCNANAWVLAYSLFKSLQYSATLTDNIAAFALISAEICLANRRPLKAFTILKQNNMLCTSRSKWNVISEPNDERVRVMIINLLLDVLCQEHPDRAFYIFTYLLKDQTRIYHPVDLTAHIDKLVTGILNGKCNDLISDVGRLIIENNFTLKSSVLQSLIINIYKDDIALCRQIHRYGTWLGVYPIVKLTLPLHIIIKTNWTKEEMHLVVIDFLEKLSMDIGPAIDHIGPNQFMIHVVFELAPFKEQLLDNDAQISNKDELKMSKELMKSVLQERFNPPLKTIVAEKERFMKLQSRSVVNYLKSMILQG